MKEMQSFAENLKREESQALKKMFGGRIKQSFLIEMKERILRISKYKLLASKVYGI